MRTASKQDFCLKVECYERDIFEIINYVKKFIFENDCNCLEVDVTTLNLIDSTKVAIMCSTYHFAKYPSGRILWIVNDNETMYCIRHLKLKNVELELRPRKNETIEYIEKKFRSSIF